MKKIIHVDYCDLGLNHVKTQFFWHEFLSERFELVISDQPDFLIYSGFGDQHRLHAGVKIFVTGESARPDFRQCDYALTCHHLDDPRHLRVPFYFTHGRAEQIVKANDDHAQILAAKTKFCSFVVGNHNPRKNQNRVDFFNRLSKYKRVDSAGRYLNNIGGPIPGWSAGKIKFLRDYKFNIAFENAAIPGYTTEKIFEAMVARSLPVYWGDPLVHLDFNPRSFLNHADFPGEEALIEKVIELDRDDSKYLEYMRQPYLHHDEPGPSFDRARVLDFFEKIFSEGPGPAARRQKRKWFSFGRWILVKRHRLRPQ